MYGTKPMTSDLREEVCIALEKAGIAAVFIEYNGAHDESYIESARLFEKEQLEEGRLPGVYLGESVEPKYTVSCDFYESNEEAERLFFDERFGEKLAQPIYDRYGYFGDSVDGVSGICEWDVPERKVVFHHSSLEWQGERHTLYIDGTEETVED